MLSVCGMRSSYRRLYPCLSQKLSSSAPKELNNSSSTSWPSFRAAKPTSKANKLFFPNPLANYSSKPKPKLSHPIRYARHLNVKLASLKRTGQHLELFESVRKFASIGDRVTILFNIAKITEKDERQKKELGKEREKLQQGQSSLYIELLESISNEISNCNPWNLANLMWALGKIQERDHEVLHVCEREILSRRIVAFNNAQICQIVNGCSSLNLTTSNIFTVLEEAIFNEEVNIHNFENRELSGILLSFAKTDNAFVELFHVFLEEILSRDFLTIGSRALAEFVWSFAKKEFKADKLFLQVEEAILSRGTTDLNNAALTKILWAFGRSERGSKQFFYFLDNELASCHVETFDNSLLLQIVWCFTKRNVTKAKVFEVVEKEVFTRGVHTFKIHELVLILFSFVSAQRQTDMLVAEIERELCSKDAKQFSKGDLRQIAWSLGRAGKSNSKLFDAIETEVLQRGMYDLPSKENNMLMLMRGFIEAKRGSKPLYEFLARFFATTDFRNLDESGICECAWCFTKVDIGVGEVFDSLEAEVFKRNRYFFSDSQIAFLNRCFQKVGKGNKQPFS